VENETSRNGSGSLSRDAEKQLMRARFGPIAATTIIIALTLMAMSAAAAIPANANTATMAYNEISATAIPATTFCASGAENMAAMTQMGVWQHPIRAISVVVVIGTFDNTEATTANTASKDIGQNPLNAVIRGNTDMLGAACIAC